jgi:prolipoprotein diacylglyceryltransferase
MVFSKLGCFFTGCCHGRPYDGFFSVIYNSGSHALLQNVPLFPIQLAEALVRTAVLCLMIVIYYKDYFYQYRIPLFFCLLGNSYFWGMLFWYDGVKLINRSGIDYIFIFNILFGIGTLTCIALHLSDKTRKSLHK